MQILLADDSSPIQKVVKIALSSLQCDFAYASNFLEAQKELEKKTAKVFIVDAGLAGATSVADISKLCEIAAIPTVVLLGSYEKYSEQDLLTAGLHNILKKPFDGTQLLEMVQKLIELEIPTPIMTVPPSFPSIPRLIKIPFGNDEQKSAQATPEPEPAKMFKPPAFKPEIPQMPARSEIDHDQVFAKLQREMQTLVKDYCEKNFKAIAREILTAELRRLAEEKARHLVD